MERKLIIVLIALQSIYITGFGQQEIKIGEKIPEINLNLVLNGTQITKTTSALYKDGLLIINFWATWCVPCVREMPFIEDIQKKKSGSLNIVNASHEKQSVVKKYLDNNRNLKNLSFISEEKVLIKYFPHRLLPYNVWIDREGIVRAFTGDEDLTEKNVNLFLKGDYSALVQRVQDMEFDTTKGFHNQDSVYLVKSIIGGNNPSVGGGAIWESGMHKAGSKRFFQYNASRAYLYWSAYMPKGEFFDRSRIIFKNADSLAYVAPMVPDNGVRRTEEKIAADRQWTKENAFYYELAYPQPVPDSVFQERMKRDLDDVFKARVEIIHQERWTYVIKRNRNFSAKPSTAKTRYWSEDNGIVSASNVSTDHIKRTLEIKYARKHFLFKDESGIDFSFDFSFTIDSSKAMTIEYLIDKFKPLGLDIVSEKRSQPILVFR